MGILLKIINISLTPRCWVSQITVYACTIGFCFNCHTDKLCTNYFGKLCINILVTFGFIFKNMIAQLYDSVSKYFFTGSMCVA